MNYIDEKGSDFMYSDNRQTFNNIMAKNITEFCAKKGI